LWQWAIFAIGANAVPTLSDQLPVKTRGRPKGSNHAMTGLYVKSPKGLKLRDRSVQRIVAKMRELCPWIEMQDLPLLRRWAEIELHASRIHAFLKLIGEVNNQGDPRRLINELRMLAQTQASIGAQLGLSPASRMAIKATGTRAAFDLPGSMARAATETTADELDDG
jgi:hypothetical protein